LQRTISRGAIIVTPTKTAAGELTDLVGIAPSHVRAISPVVPALAPSLGGVDLVVAVTGSFDRFSAIAPALVNVARARGGRVVLLASTAVAQRSHQLNGVVVRPRHEARAALAQARLALQLSDDARFPSFAVAAAGAGVPTIVRSTPLTREILSGAAALVDSDDVMAEVVDALWRTETQRTILVAAGRVRARDFSASAVATDYATLYRSLV
jgi:glycosyltransferase involved in cell wall biosynthesis